MNTPILTLVISSSLIIIIDGVKQPFSLGFGWSPAGGCYGNFPKYSPTNSTSYSYLTPPAPTTIILVP